MDNSRDKRCVWHVMYVQGIQKHTVMNLAWTIGESDTQQFYVGLEALVLETETASESSTVVMEFTDPDCINDYCDLCHDSSIFTVFLVAICFILSIPPLVINYKRSLRNGDRNYLKFWCVMLLLFKFMYLTASFVASYIIYSWLCKRAC
jgi:hypothetical protein